MTGVIRIVNIKATKLLRVYCTNGDKVVHHTYLIITGSDNTKRNLVLERKPRVRNETELGREGFFLLSCAFS